MNYKNRDVEADALIARIERAIVRLGGTPRTEWQERMSTVNLDIQDLQRYAETMESNLRAPGVAGSTDTVLSRREQFAMAAMQGMLAEGAQEYTFKSAAQASVNAADALIAELKNPAGGCES